ncbi:MAG: HNH endonuclease [Paraburkholderia sp.]|uniref:HNH endonuclease n=1 Tax=Paraburkholderia sp. TaxID=1926495 RepID=UPI00120C4C3D|nr:HNH endonuclease [Paraburkholderia sp.]TAL98642.1 MAG: HNH endonuclease [Paraburkholderia sp.]
MSKYSPLAEYLQHHDRTEVTLSFDKIEQIIGEKLPPTADSYRPFWANSTVKDGHPGRLWLSVGWRQVSLDRANRLVTFSRAENMSSDLESLRPQKKELLYDLLKEAGFSVEEWHRTIRGDPVKKFKSNGRFCYEWCFGSVEEGFALCLWFDELTVDKHGRVVFDHNVRDTRAELLATKNDETADQKKRNSAAEKIPRAERLDDAIKESARRGLAVRILIGERDPRKIEEVPEEASSVERRLLDKIDWYIHSYDTKTGACLVVRGVEPDASGSDEEYGDDVTYDEVQNRAIKTRRGQTRFRQQLLDAYRRGCAITGSRITELLEAAHIVPHSLMTNYSTRNGLLLKTDIHTLYDLHLISVDATYTVHVSRRLANTDYGKLHGKKLEIFPDRSADQPSSTALEKRHALFLEEERTR